MPMDEGLASAAWSVAFALIETARMNGIAPREWLARVRERINDRTADKIDEFLPRNFQNSAG